MSQESDRAADGDPDVAVEVVAVTDGAYTLLVADYNDVDAAREAYERLKDIEDGRTVEIEGVIVVIRNADGRLEVQKVTDHTTRRGLGWGVVGGVMLGVIFPPSILASAAVLGATGAATGALIERHHKHELAQQLQGAIDPGHSGVIALVSDPGVLEIRKALEEANRVVESAVDKVVADEIKAAAKKDPE